MRKLLITRYFWYAAITAFLACIFCFVPQFTSLADFPIKADWQISFYLAAYRLLFPISVALASWRFGVKGGLVVCLTAGPVILSSLFVNSRFPNVWVDIGDLALGGLICWLVGKQGEMKQRLEKTMDDLKEQSARLVSEIAERKQAEEKIELVAGQWAATFDSILDWIYIVDNDMRLLRVNKAFANAFGKNQQDLIGKPCYKIVHNTSEPVQGCPHRKAISSKIPVTVDYFEPELGLHLEITTSPLFDDKGNITGAVHIARDISERKHMQEQLMLADRLASVGELASGIAHEINNPLTSIITFSKLLLDRDVPDDMKEDLSIVNDEARRTAEIVKNLLTFARKHPPKKQSVRVHEIIDEVLKLRTHDHQVHNIHISRQYAPDVPEIMLDYFQMQQVFFNIIINAEYFMTLEHNGGTLVIATEKQEGYVRICFADDGPGIKPQNLSRLFTPFFTTKEVGRGTGLGLSICHGIVAEHNGRIYVESQHGQGTTFIIELPVGGT